MKKVERIASVLLLTAVKLYRKFISPVLPPSCRYHPTCSEYMIIAIEENGPVIGFLQGLGRILRCNPFFPGGVDFPRKRRRVRTWLEELF